MSYSIIFETKIVRLPDGRILHLSLQGCNNDNAGRSRDDFRGKIYAEEEFKEMAENFKKDRLPMKEADGFDLKIGSRYCTYYDYGEHLLRMLKRSITWDELTEKRRCYAEVFTGVTVNKGKPEEIFYSPAEWEKVCYDYMYGRKIGTTTAHRSYLYEEKEIMEALDKDANHISFFIGKEM